MGSAYVYISIFNAIVLKKFNKNYFYELKNKNSEVKEYEMNTAPLWSSNTIINNLLLFWRALSDLQVNKY